MTAHKKALRFGYRCHKCVSFHRHTHTRENWFTSNPDHLIQFLSLEFERYVLFSSINEFRKMNYEKSQVNLVRNKYEQQSMFPQLRHNFMPWQVNEREHLPLAYIGYSGTRGNFSRN